MKPKYYRKWLRPNNGWGDMTSYHHCIETWADTNINCEIQLRDCSNSIHLYCSADNQKHFNAQLKCIDTLIDCLQHSRAEFVKVWEELNQEESK